MFWKKLDIFVEENGIVGYKEVRLVIDIVENDVLKPGQNIYTRKVVRFSSLISPPLWWDDVVVESLLGKYTETKFRLFMEVTGVGDLTDLSESERWSLARQFKYYLIEKKTREIRCRMKMDRICLFR